MSAWHKGSSERRLTPIQIVDAAAEDSRRRESPARRCPGDSRSHE